MSKNVQEKKSYVSINNELSKKKGELRSRKVTESALSSGWSWVRILVESGHSMSKRA